MVVEPMPNARVRTATVVKPGFFRSIRRPNEHLGRVPSLAPVRAERICSFTCSTPPSAICGAASFVGSCLWRCFVGCEIEEGLEFVVEITVDGFAAEKRAETQRQ